MNEFDFIARYLRPLAGPEALSLSDDAAIFKPPAGHELVIAKDTLVEGVHFPNGRYGAELAERAMRVNLSDMAAMGATPIGYLLSLALPETLPEAYLKGFALGLQECQDLFGVRLFGGDTVRTSGAYVVSLTVIGYVPEGKAVRRNGAKAGDRIFVTGPIGDAAMGLRLIQSDPALKGVSGEAIQRWEDAYWRPHPQLDIRKLIRQYAHSAIDISDGLIADAGHIAATSDVKLTLSLSDIPLSGPTQAWIRIQADQQAEYLALCCAGDDYQLLLTVPEDRSLDFMRSTASVGIQCYDIGEVNSGEGVQVYGFDGEVLKIDRTGYQHF